MARKIARLFGHLRSQIEAKRYHDLEPAERFKPTWRAWQAREAQRQRQLTELAEAEALSTFPEDPAPIASLGLAAFLEWYRRQAQRRRFR